MTDKRDGIDWFTSELRDASCLNFINSYDGCYSSVDEEVNVCMIEKMCTDDSWIDRDEHYTMAYNQLYMNLKIKR